MPQGLHFSATPVTPIEIENISNKIYLRIKRDDLFSSVIGSGGSKARKAIYIVPYAALNGYDCIVTNGGLHSNHARAIALLSAVYQIKCHIILHIDDNTVPCGDNLTMIKLSGASVEFCKNSDLGSAMDAAIDRFKKEGFNPLYVWGGGHCPQGTLAYKEAADEFLDQSPDWIPDYVVHASGTGTTQAGLIYGFRDYSTRIIGISIARGKERGNSVIEQSLKDFMSYYNLPYQSFQIDFRDNWIMGGYEKYTDELKDFIFSIATQGILLDPTYTGKAFYGMFELINTGEIPHGSKVLFWHTGGLFNLLSSKCIP